MLLALRSLLPKHSNKVVAIPYIPTFQVPSKLSHSSVNRLIMSMADRDAGNDIALALNAALFTANQTNWAIFAMIVATSTSRVVDFASIKSKDVVLHIRTSQGTTNFCVVMENGILPQDVIVGDLYIILRISNVPDFKRQGL